MEEKMSGIVLGGVNYNENDKILNIFTLEKGVVSAKIKGVKKAGAKLKFVAEPFCFAEIIFSHLNNKRTVIGASLLDSFYPVRENIHRYFAGGAVLEFIKKFYKENIVEPDEFFEVVEALKEIAYGDNYISALVKFFVSALRTSGFSLTLSGCFKCGCELNKRTFFDYRSGAFYCEDCFDGMGREINTATYLALRDAENGLLKDDNKNGIKALKLIEYYIENRADEKIVSLSELIKMNP